MAAIETYVDLEEVDCRLCPQPVVHLDEVVVIADNTPLHLECFEQASLETLADIVRNHRRTTSATLALGAA